MAAVQMAGRGPPLTHYITLHYITLVVVRPKSDSNKLNCRGISGPGIHPATSLTDIWSGGECTPGVKAAAQ
jgi:hypothetical protein